MKKKRMIKIDASSMKIQEAEKLLNGLFELKKILKLQGLRMSIKRIKPKTPKP